MSRQKNYFVNYKEIETGKISKGYLTQGKCERSALFTLELHMDKTGWELNRITEISDKVYNRLKNLERIKKEKEHQEWLANGGRERLQQKLANLAALNAMIDGPYGKNGL